MDPLEDILTAMRVRDALYARVEARAPWGVAFGRDERLRFAVVVHGQCLLSAPGLEAPVALHAGDCFIVKGEACFDLQDAQGRPLQPCGEIFGGEGGDRVSIGGKGPATLIVAGRFAFDPAGGAPLMTLLPAVLKVPLEGERARLMQATLQLIAAEVAAPSPGGRLVVQRLAEVLFVQAVRAYCASDAAPRTGWLAALADRRLAAALSALHGDLAGPWTVASLAAVAGMSRSAFAARFRRVVGDTPLNYLLRWRIYRAEALLRHGDLALGEIADRVGYDSDAAFNRAFKRTLGVAPGEYRRRLAT